MKFINYIVFLLIATSLGLTVWTDYNLNSKIEKVHLSQDTSASIINGHSLALRTIVNQGMRTSLVQFDTMTRRQKIWEDVKLVELKLDTLRKEYIKDPNNKEVETKLLLVLEKMKAVQSQQIK